VQRVRRDHTLGETVQRGIHARLDASGTVEH
jgi:hypothetical protein